MYGSLFPKEYEIDINADLNEMLLFIFSKEPVAQQPRNLVVVGTESSEFINNLYTFIQNSTPRGKVLGQFPLALFTFASKQAMGPKNLSQALLIFVLPKTEMQAEVFWQQDFETLKHLIIFSQYSADTWLMNAAKNQWFFEIGHCKTYRSNSTLPHYNLIYFSKQNYHIRHPVEADLSALMQIEQITWPAPIAMSETIIRNRITQHPQDHLVIEQENTIFAVVYSQRIMDISAVFTKNAVNISELRDDKGSIVQLLALNVLPEYFRLGLGDNLLEWMLQWCTFRPNISTVIGITRWKNYSDYPELTPEQYLIYCTNSGEIVNPIPHMHQKHGASIESLIPNYRPNDVENKAYGVLVYYALSTRKRITKESAPGKLTEGEIGTFVEQSIMEILGEKVRGKFILTTPLIDLGFESISLMELRALLSDKFKEEINPTFFFQYGTAEAIIQFFIELKLHAYQEWLYDVQWSEIPKPLELVKNLQKRAFGLFLQMRVILAKNWRRNYQLMNKAS